MAAVRCLPDRVGFSKTYIDYVVVDIDTFLFCRYYSGKRGTDGPWTGIGLALTDEGRELFEGVQIGFKRRTGKNLSQCSD